MTRMNAAILHPFRSRSSSIMIIKQQQKRNRIGVNTLSLRTFAQQNNNNNNNNLLLTKGQKVSIQYKLFNTLTNELIDDTATRVPKGKGIEVTLGSGELFPKLENKLLEECKVGSKMSISLMPEDTYGERDEKKIQKQPIVPEEMKKVREEIEVGQVVQLAPNVIAKVLEIGEDSLTLDFNHPLAGFNLTFEIDVLSVKEAPTLFGTPLVKFNPQR